MLVSALHFLFFFSVSVSSLLFFFFFFVFFFNLFPLLAMGLDLSGSSSFGSYPKDN